MQIKFLGHYTNNVFFSSIFPVLLWYCITVALKITFNIYHSLALKTETITEGIFDKLFLKHDKK